MAAVEQQSSENTLGPDSPIYVWLRAHNEGESFDRNGVKAPLDENRLAVPVIDQRDKTVPVTAASLGETRTTADIWADVPYDGPEGAIDQSPEAQVDSLPVEPAAIARKGLWRRVADLKDKFFYAPLNFSVRRLNKAEEKQAEITSDTENFGEDAAEKKRRRPSVKKLGAAAITLAALGAGMYFASKGFDHGNLANAQHAAASPAHEAQYHAKVTKEALPAISAPVKANPDQTSHMIRNTAKTVAKAREYRETLKYYGDNIWNHIQSRVEAKFPHADKQKILNLTIKFTKIALRQNNLTPQDATHMNVGESIVMPHELG